MAIYSQGGVKKGFDGNLVAFKEKQRNSVSSNQNF